MSIGSRVAELLCVDYEQRLMIFDDGGFKSSVFDYMPMLAERKFITYVYTDIEKFRLTYEKQIRPEIDRKSDIKFAVVVPVRIYVPYDIRIRFRQVEASLARLYPRMSPIVIERHIDDISIINHIYDEYYGGPIDERETTRHIERFAADSEETERFVRSVERDADAAAESAKTYRDWIDTAKLHASTEYYAARFGIQRDTAARDTRNERFWSFLLADYKKLSGEINLLSPPILPKTWDMIADEGQKTVLIVMDGMSMFDFEVIRRTNWPFEYDLGGSFGLIPTVTSISRQALIAGKYPKQLDDPFSLAKEEAGFYAKAEELGVPKHNAYFGRGWDARPSAGARLAGIIVNVVDDTVHGASNGRASMYADMTIMAKSGKLQEMVADLMALGFDVYITADHGNAECTGTGTLKRTGVETKTKSRRMIILEDFAQISDDLTERTVEWPATYMPSNYRYFISKASTSFDGIGETVMTHGGVTIDEVIVPFIHIKGVKKDA